MASAKNSRLGFLFWGIRYDNIIFFLGFPAVGILFTMPDFSSAHLGKAALFLFFNSLFLAEVFLYNDLGDAVLDPREPSRRTFHGLKRPEIVSERAVSIICAALAASGCIGCLILSAWSGLMVIIMLCITTIYSYPRLNLKRHLFLPESAHFMVAALLFLCGWNLFEKISAQALLIALFFGLSLATINFTNEIEHFDDEMEVGMRTTAIVFGRKPIYRFSLYMFFAIAGGLFILALIDRVPGFLKWPALSLMILWPGFALGTAKMDMLKNISLFRRVIIRAIYLVFGILLVWQIVLHKF